MRCLILCGALSALAATSCVPGVQGVNIKAEGTIVFDVFEGGPVTVDLTECWQDSYWIYKSGEASANILDIVCDLFSVQISFADTPPESKELDAFPFVDLYPFDIHWNKEIFSKHKFKEECRGSSNYTFPYIKPKKVLVSDHDGEAPYIYHLITYPSEKYCAVYDMKIYVLSEPSGDRVPPKQPDPRHK